MLATLDINIIQIAEPLIGKTENGKFNFITKTSVSQLHDKLDVFILAIEGACSHLKFLDAKKSKKLLNETNDIIEDFYALDDILSSQNDFSDKDLKEKMNYSLKTLYKFESILHKNVYKNQPVHKAPKDITDKISKINKNTLSKSIL